MSDLMKIIIGLGITGLSCARYFTRKQTPFQVVDTRPTPPLLAEFKQSFSSIPLHLGGLHENLLAQADEIIISPGISPTLPALQRLRAQGVSIIGDVELFAREATAPIIAITGSNAKGTVTTLVGNMIKAAGHTALVGGNIGTPCLDLLLAPTPDVYVLELSSFQLETTFSLHTQAATILNISPDHLDRHGTLENYIAAKQRIYTQCQYAIYNGDEVATHPITPCPHPLTFGLSSDRFSYHLMQKERDIFLAHKQTALMPVRDLKIRGKHNWANALAALALGSTLDLPVEAMCTALKTFCGLPHRCQWIGEINHVPWFDDSKGTNVGATLAAIEGLGPTLSGKIVLIAGGIGKGADFRILQTAVAQFVKTIILFGQDAPLLAQALQDHAPLIQVNTLMAAATAAKQQACTGDAVLLSPACASLDMFKDYNDRGEQFVTCFQALSTPDLPSLT